MSDILDRLKKNSTIKDTAILKNSKFFEAESKINSGVPGLNIALSGEIDGGLTSGLTVLAGPSKNFKCLGGGTKLIVYVDE